MKDDKFLVPVAVHLFLMNQEQILMLRRYNTGFEDGNYSLVAGHLDGGETVIQAMIREAREEAGISISAENLEISLVMQRKSTVERIDYFLFCTKWNGEIQNMEPHKCDNIEWFPIDKLPANTIPYIREAISKYLAGEKFAIFGFN